MAAAAGTEAALRVVRPWMLRLVGLFNPGARETIEMLYEFEADFVLDSSAAERELGLAPTPLADAAAATVAGSPGPVADVSCGRGRPRRRGRGRWARPSG